MCPIKHTADEGIFTQGVVGEKEQLDGCHQGHDHMVVATPVQIIGVC